MKNIHFGLLIIRVTIGLMLPHGINKLVHPEALGYITHLLEQKGLPSAISYGVFIGEIIAPFFVLIGLRTRLSALVMVATGFMVLFLAYSDKIFSLTEPNCLRYSFSLHWQLLLWVVVNTLFLRRASGISFPFLYLKIKIRTLKDSDFFMHLFY